MSLLLLIAKPSLGQAPRCPSNLDLAPDLDHVIARQLEIVADPLRVAPERGEQRLLPVRDSLAVLARHDGFAADVEGHIVEVDVHPVRLALSQDSGDVWMFHEPAPRLRPPELVVDTLEVQPLLRI